MTYFPRTIARTLRRARREAARSFEGRGLPERLDHERRITELELELGERADQIKNLSERLAALERRG